MLHIAGADQVSLLREWRNQQANREVSINSHVITAEEHAAWWARTSADPTRRVLVFEAEGRPSGVVTFFDLALDETPRTGSWGFFLDHETATAEGTSMLLWMRIMAEATDYAFDELGLDVLNGEVLEHNEAVRAMNRRFRFAEGEPRLLSREGEAEERDADGRTLRVIPISLHKSNRRTRRST